MSAGTSTISLSGLGWASPQHFYYRAAFTSNGTYTPILNLVSLTYLVTVPNAPTGLTATPGNAQISLSWTAPANTGGTPLTNYFIDYQLTSTSTWSQFDVRFRLRPPRLSLASVSNGSAYNFEVYAVNAVGASASSSNMATATPATVPGAPTIGTAAGGNAQATITFATSTNGGSAILYYTAISNVGGFSATSTGSPITVTGLVNGTTYTFTVTATNGVGTGAARPRRTR